MLKKIVLDIMPYIDRLHQLLYKNKGSSVVNNVNDGLFRFSPGIRCPLNYLKIDNIKIATSYKYESKTPYLSFIGYEALELYIANRLSIIGMTEATAHLYSYNPILKLLGKPYTRFTMDENDNLLTNVLDLEQLYGITDIPTSKEITLLQQHLDIYLNKLAPYVENKMCSVDLKLETPILIIENDIRDFRLMETEKEVETW